MPWKIPTTSLFPIATASVTVLAIMKSSSEKARYYINLSLYVCALLTTSALALGVAVFLTLIGQRLNTNHYVARTFYHMVNPLVGIKLEIEGEEHLDPKNGPAVIVGNHQSFIDILYLGRMFPKKASIMAKKELAWTPFLGWWMSLSGTIWIDRKKSKSALASMAKAGDDMKRKGISVFIFPEGTRSNKPELDLLPFKKGAFHLAVEAQVPIVPVICENYHRLFDGKGRMNGGVLKIRVLPPIPTASLTSSDVSSLTDSTREKMLSTLREISKAPSSSRRASSSNNTTATNTSPASYAAVAASGPSETEPLLASSPSPNTNVNAEGSSTDYGGVLTGSKLKEEVREAAVGNGGDKSGAETEDEMDEGGAVIVPRSS